MENRPLQLEIPVFHFGFRPPPADQFRNPKSKIGMPVSVTTMCHNTGYVKAWPFTLVLVPDKKSP